MFSTSQLYIFSITPQCSKVFSCRHQFTSDGRPFENQPLLLHCKYNSLPQATYRQNHVYLHLSKHQRKTTAPRRKLIHKTLLKCYKQLSTRVNRCTNRGKQALRQDPQRELAACPLPTQVSGRQVLRARWVITKAQLMLCSQRSPGTQINRYQKWLP